MSCLRSGSVVGLSRVWLSLGLVVSLTAVLVGSPAPAGAVAGYGDVPESTWYTDAVQWSVDNGIADIAGFCFAPETPVSRGETAVWIYNMENQPDSGEPHPFTDVSDASQDDAISWMADNEITTGTSPTTFAPDETLRRAQAAAFLHRLAGEPSAPPHNFSDVVADWQQDAVSWMAHNEITTGTSPTTFAPEDTLTRAHLVTFLYRYQGDPEVTVNALTPLCDPTAGVPTSFKSVSASSGHSCGIRSDDTIVCWGDNEYGPAGGFKSVSAGGDHSCGIRSDDTVVCWGLSHFGKTTAPAGGFKAVSAGGSHSCGIGSDDTAVCWGDNRERQATVPVGGFKAVSAGGSHSCAIRSDNTIVCWGSNRFGQASAPVGGFKAVSAGREYSCAIGSDDTVVCWGSNHSGQSTAPAGGFKAVSAGYDHSCGLRSDDTAVCWGNNEYGQVSAPAGGFKAVSAGYDHSCGLRSDDTVVCWGDNSRRQTTVPTRSLKAEIVNNNPNNIPGYDPDIFYTEENDLSRFIKEEIVDRYAEDNPWLMEVWNYTNRSDFKYELADNRSTSVSWVTPNTTSTLLKVEIIKLTTQERCLKNLYCWTDLIHEMAHIYTLANGISSHPEALAVAHLYFKQLAKDTCDAIELYADAAQLLVPLANNTYSPYWHNCPHLPQFVTSEAETIVRSSFTGKMPQWFYNTFQEDNGSLDYKAIWSEVRALRPRERTIVVYQLKDAFGGYCSDSAAKKSAFGSLNLDQPWRDGGCPADS